MDDHVKNGSVPDYIQEGQWDVVKISETFNEREIKELTLRIGDEILETMKWAMPEKIYNIIINYKII